MRILLYLKLQYAKIISDISEKQGGLGMNADYCCLDASAFSLGFASSHKNTLILERSENVLSDYVNAVRPCTVTAPRTDEGRVFTEHLRKAGCVSDKGILDAPSLAPAAAQYALHMKFEVLLGVSVIGCEENRIQIYTNSGIQNVFCRKIVRCPAVKTDIKRLNCIVSGIDRDTLSAFGACGGRISKSFEKDEFILSLPFSSECTIHEARIAFVNQIKACFGSSVPIDAFAADFEYGSGFCGITEEFEAGVNYDLL